MKNSLNSLPLTLRPDRSDWIKNLRLFVFEASTIDYSGELCVNVVSPKTGQIARFYKADTVRDLDGDVVYWLFEPCDLSLRYKCRMEIWND